MKRIIILLLVIFNHPAFSQVNDQLITTKVTKTNLKALDPGIGPSPEVYPIISGKVSATPISIPSPNNTPVRLQAMDRIMYNSNNSVINECNFLNYTDNTLKIKIQYTTSSNIRADLPVYAGAWFYDKNDNAVDVGYVPQEIANRPSGSVIVSMGFQKYSVTTEYIKVMLLQNGKEIANRNFNACFLWKAPKPAMLKSTGVTNGINSDDVNRYVPDLEITAIKVIDNNQNTLAYETNCMLKDKVIFITNIGNRESAPYILSVGYIAYNGKRGSYKEVKRFQMTSLLPGSQTLQAVHIPDEADNIRVTIIYNNNTNGEFNTQNNYMEKRCISIK
jgi:hypothetical protein